MGAARKLVEKTKEIVRALGIYRKKTGEQVREERRKSEGAWVCQTFPIEWTMHLHRICDGRAQFGLVLRIFAYTMGAPRYGKKEAPPEWTPGLIDEDWAKELDLARNTVREAIDGAVARGLIARMDDNPKARGRGYYKLRLLPENWAVIVDPITPKKQPARAETPENESKRPEGEGPLHHVRPGTPVEFSVGHRYEFEVPPTVFENYLETPGKMVMNAAGLLRLDPVKGKAPIVEMPVSESAPTANKGEKAQSRSGGPKRSERLNLADIPLTVAAMKESGFHYGTNFLPELLKRTREAVVSTGAEEELVRDHVVAWGIAACQLPKQRSAALFWETVPSWVAAHLHDKTPPAKGRGKAKSQSEEFAERIARGEF